MLLRRIPSGKPLTVIFPGKTIGTYQVGRGSAAVPVTGAKRAIVARATRLDLTFQSQRPGPDARQGERDPQIERIARSLAASPIAVSLQALVQVIDRKPDVVLHRPVIRTLKVKQVHSAFNRHEHMITRDYVGSKF